MSMMYACRKPKWHHETDAARLTADRHSTAASIDTMAPYGAGDDAMTRPSRATITAAMTRSMTSPTAVRRCRCEHTT